MRRHNIAAGNVVDSTLEMFMSSQRPLIGVLAVQGDFAAHSTMLDRVGAGAREVRRAVDMDELDGLIIPGGESTAMLKALDGDGLADAIKACSAEGKSVLGTCAGAILLARRVTGPEQPSLDIIDIVVERNAYGRQVDSFITPAETTLDGGPLEAVFIRAPRIRRIGKDIDVLARVNNEPVMVRSANILVATFHPELSADERVHRLFLSMIASRSRAHLTGVYSRPRPAAPYR